MVGDLGEVRVKVKSIACPQESIVYRESSERELVEMTASRWRVDAPAAPSEMSDVCCARGKSDQSEVAADREKRHEEIKPHALRLWQQPPWLSQRQCDASNLERSPAWVERKRLG